MRSTPQRIVSFFASLKLAVVVILAMALSCATATVLESLYDTKTARYWVYHSTAFRTLLGVFALILIAVMIDRWPWKKKHIPFILAHIGILMLLFGSLLTDRIGLDGSMTISEGESTSIVDEDQPLLVITEGEKVSTYSVPWIPPTVKFKPYSLRDEGSPYDISVTGYMTHADSDYDFVPKPPYPVEDRATPHAQPALKIRITGGPMRITQDLWLWTGDPSTQGFQAGPAWLELIDHTDPDPKNVPGPDHGPKLSFSVDKGGVLSYRAESRTKEIVQGRIPFRSIANHEIDPHWMSVKISLLDFVPDAWVKTNYSPARIQYGDSAPPSAIQVTAGQGANSSSIWLGMGARALLAANGHDLEIGYFNKRLMLPFAIRLDRFTVDHYPGTMNPASYSSQVTVLGDKNFDQLISMNEPLKYKGITLYQASYQDAQPRPVTSILSVNRDPGRIWKYLGSILIVMGSAWLFGRKYRRTGVKKETTA